MKSTDTYCVVYCTYPKKEVAESMARQLLESRLVACTNILPGVSSHYVWENKLIQGAELLLVMKTRQDKLHDLEKAINASHPYDFPEFIAMPIIYGNKAYCDWIDECVGD